MNQQKNNKNLLIHSRINPAAAVVVMLLSLLAAGCNLPASSPEIESTQSPAAEENLGVFASLTAEAGIRESETASAPTVTLLQPTSIVMPSATQNPSSTPTPEDLSLPDDTTAVRFRDGGTIDYRQRQISAGEKHHYTVQAAAGQTLIVGVSSDNLDVYLGVYGLDTEETLLPLSDEKTSAAILLPESQPYLVTVYASQTDTTYFLTFEIPAVLSIAAGEDLREINGYVDVLQQYHPNAFTRVRYQIFAEEGQVLDVELETEAEEDLTLALIGGEDGQPYLRHVVKSSSIDLEVPVTQDYYLDVYSVTGVSAAYTLEIKIHKSSQD